MYQSRLKCLVIAFKVTYKRLLLRAKSTGAWLSVCGTTVSGTVLSTTEFWYFLCARYNVSTINLQSHCDRCGTSFVVTRALSCSIGGLVIARHNEIHDKLFYLSRHVFTSAYIHAEPLIHQGRTRSEQEMCHGSDKDKEIQGDVMIQGLWNRQVNAIIDVNLGDTDADTYKYNPMTALLARW